MQKYKGLKKPVTRYRAQVTNISSEQVFFHTNLHAWENTVIAKSFDGLFSFNYFRIPRQLELLIFFPTQF